MIGESAALVMPRIIVTPTSLRSTPLSSHTARRNPE